MTEYTLPSTVALELNVYAFATQVHPIKRTALQYLVAIWKLFWTR